MTERGRSERTARLEALCWLALLAAITPNTVAAFTTPGAAWWQPLRLCLSAGFVLVLMALVASRILDRRREPPRCR
jgi:hypothetical protein